MQLGCAIPVILALCSCGIPAASGYGADEITARASSGLWHAGMGLGAGDHFEYDVCDATGAPASGPHCYAVRLEFVALLGSGAGDVWVVQSLVREGAEEPVRHILFIDPRTMSAAAASAGSRAHADSVGQTVLYLAGLANEHSPKRLAVGEWWGDVGSILPHSRLIVASQTAIPGDSPGAFVLEHDFFETSTFIVAGGVSLPVSGTLYDPYWPLPDPGVLFSFEMTGSSQTGPLRQGCDRGRRNAADRTPAPFNPARGMRA